MLKPSEVCTGQASGLLHKSVSGSWLLSAKLMMSYVYKGQSLSLAGESEQNISRKACDMYHQQMANNKSTSTNWFPIDIHCAWGMKPNKHVQYVQSLMQSVYAITNATSVCNHLCNQCMQWLMQNVGEHEKIVDLVEGLQLSYRGGCLFNI